MKCKYKSFVSSLQGNQNLFMFIWFDLVRLDSNRVATSTNCISIRFHSNNFSVLIEYRSTGKSYNQHRWHGADGTSTSISTNSSSRIGYWIRRPAARDAGLWCHVPSRTFHTTSPVHATWTWNDCPNVCWVSDTSATTRTSNGRSSTSYTGNDIEQQFWRWLPKGFGGSTASSSSLYITSS